MSGRLSLAVLLCGLAVGVLRASTQGVDADTAGGAGQEGGAPARAAFDNPRLARLLQEASLSAGVSDMARLAESGADESILAAQVKNSDHAYRLSPEDVAHLRGHGVPDAVITAMIERGGEVRAQRASIQPPAPAPVPASGPVVAVVQPVPVNLVTIVPASRPAEPQSTLTIIGRSNLARGLSYRNYYYSPRNFYSSRTYGSVYASFGNYGRTYPGRGGHGMHRDRFCR